MIRITVFLFTIILINVFANPVYAADAIVEPVESSNTDVPEYIMLLVVAVSGFLLGMFFGRKQSASNKEYLEMHEALKTEMEAKIETLRTKLEAIKSSGRG